MTEPSGLTPEFRAEASCLRFEICQRDIIPLKCYYGTLFVNAFTHEINIHILVSLLPSHICNGTS